jgi:hypothetical protein
VRQTLSATGAHRRGDRRKQRLFFESGYDRRVRPSATSWWFAVSAALASRAGVFLSADVTLFPF